jgi:hypothetical protein
MAPFSHALFLPLPSLRPSILPTTPQIDPRRSLKNGQGYHESLATKALLPLECLQFTRTVVQFSHPSGDFTHYRAGRGGQFDLAFNVVLRQVALLGDGPVIGDGAKARNMVPPEGLVDGWWKQWVQVGAPLRINALQVRGVSERGLLGCRDKGVGFRACHVAGGPGMECTGNT